MTNPLNKDSLTNKEVGESIKPKKEKLFVSEKEFRKQLAQEVVKPTTKLTVQLIPNGKQVTAEIGQNNTETWHDKTKKSIETVIRATLNYIEGKITIDEREKIYDDHVDFIKQEISTVLKSYSQDMDGVINDGVDNIHYHDDKEMSNKLKTEYGIRDFGCFEKGWFLCKKMAKENQRQQKLTLDKSRGIL